MENNWDYFSVYEARQIRINPIVRVVDSELLHFSAHLAPRWVASVNPTVRALAVAFWEIALDDLIKAA